MLQIHPGTRYLLYSKWADVRKSFDGLSGLITNELKMPIESGDVFIFLNRREIHIKLLQWEGDGFSMYYKRLEEGTFELPSGFMEGTHSEDTGSAPDPVCLAVKYCASFNNIL